MADNESRFRPDKDGRPFGWIQWKGTNVCLDFHCTCGVHGHVDAEFAYTIKCGKCGQVYNMPGYVEAVPIDGPGDELTITTTIS